ncbi:glycosyltransferase family 39 protein [Patescibacteria group bacterium]|nr:glycosyltransferase family 39 protein [Patescibacteria group bacterium]MBU1868473.1 glycosyltransferase family 39 protein [Patescibacteria group bacterium]
MKRRYRLLTLIVIIGALLRFYNLDWGSPYFFHPDERNIAAAVSRLEFPSQMNPRFFAYGGFPIYVVYFLGVLSNFLAQGVSTQMISFNRAIMIGRFLSALLSTLLIPLVYLVVREIAEIRGRTKREEAAALIAGLLTAFAPGLVQYAHFSTFEIILTFEYLLLLYLCLRILSTGQTRNYVWFGVVLGFSLATKITSLIMVPLLLITYFLAKAKLKVDRGLFIDIVFIGATYLLAVVIGLVLSPYIILDYGGFRAAIDYESTVAMGSLPVFYTASFLKTIPFWYQVVHVFPYLLGWGLWVASFLSIGYLTWSLVRGRGGNRRYRQEILLLLLFVVLYFGFHGMMYVKWMRYMVPVLPFLVIVVVVSLFSIVDDGCDLAYQIPNSKFQIPKILLCLLSLATLVSGSGFFVRYLLPDPRVGAADWAAENIVPEAHFLSESWDLGVLPFNDRFSASQIDLFDFYGLDGAFGQCGEIEVPVSHVFSQIEELSELLEQGGYIILPSSRVYGSRLRFPECFPNGNRFYAKLFDESLGFKKIYQTLDYSMKASAPLADSLPFFYSEETYRVFDYPTVMIFEKVESMTAVEYQDLLLY